MAVGAAGVSKLEWVLVRLSPISPLPGSRKSSSGPQPPVAKLCVVRTKSKPFCAARRCFLAAQDEIGLHGAGERVHVAVGVFAGKDILAGCERVEVPVVGKEANGEVAISIARAALPGEKDFPAACRARPSRMTRPCVAGHIARRARCRRAGMRGDTESRVLSRAA
jgi:hypothetical protein